jgi:hypothetical protein
MILKLRLRPGLHGFRPEMRDGLQVLIELLRRGASSGQHRAAEHRRDVGLAAVLHRKNKTHGPRRVPGRKHRRDLHVAQTHGPSFY